MSDAVGGFSANLAPEEARTPEARVAGAMKGFAQEMGALSAFRLESCIHCGICADACHFYIATEDPQYTPIWKVEPFKQAYKREASPFAPLYRLLGLKRAVRADELERWQHLLFDSCNMCGRCSLICPMGIDVAALIEQARHAMFDAGLAPKELYQKAAHQRATGQPEASAEPHLSLIARPSVPAWVEILESCASCSGVNSTSIPSRYVTAGCAATRKGLAELTVFAGHRFRQKR